MEHGIVGLDNDIVGVHALVLGSTREQDDAYCGRCHDVKDRGTKHNDIAKAADFGRLHRDEDDAEDVAEWAVDGSNAPLTTLETAVHRGTQYGSHPNHPPLVAATGGLGRWVHLLVLRQHFLLPYYLPQSALLPQYFDYSLSEQRFHYWWALLRAQS